MERLSGLDSAFLSVETSSMHLHVAMMAVVDPSTMTESYRFDRLKDFIVERLRGMPTTRRRAVQVPFRLNHPLWVEDPDVDLDFHIRRHALPTPGGNAELAGLAGAIAGLPLDRRRPLWEIHVIEGLQSGHIALLGKIHHAAVDGVSGAELFVNLFDLTPEPERRPAPEEPPVERIPNDVELVTHAVMSQVRRSIGLPALVGRTARTFSQLVGRHRDPETVAGAVPLTAPRVPWSAAITPHRSVAFARVSLDEVKAIKNAFGVKVNDVVLALVGLALRRYLLDHDALPPSPLVAMCPVSVRGEGEGGQYTNMVSPMFVSLRTDVDDASEMLRSVAEATRGAKEDHNAIGAELLMDWTEHAAPATFALAARVYSRFNLADRHRPIYNLTVSNVPGPTFPLYLFGARLVAAYPMGPVSEGAGLNVTVLSYLDHLDVGFLAARELVPDLAGMAAGLDDAMTALAAAAGIERAETVDAPAAQGEGVGPESAAPALAPARAKPARRSSGGGTRPADSNGKTASRRRSPAKDA
jgi:WS/DGAT/MGAT family acyltransferase